MYLELLREGHEVRVYIGDPDAADTCLGLVPIVPDWQAELAWVADGIIVFETAHHGALQDDLRRRGYRVIGGSALGDRLECDREFGQATLRQAGMQTAAVHTFVDFAEAATFVRRAPRRYVLKLNGAGFASSRTYIGQRDDGRDLLSLLTWHSTRWPVQPSFVLMEHRSGVEVGVGAYFNGQAFLRPACLDWEHKRFFPGDLGELTGEMGTVATYRQSDRLFDATLARLAPILAASGYVGYINLNTIVNADGVWPLELTCRFGYPGYAVLRPLQTVRWSALFTRLCSRDSLALPTRPGYSVAVVLTVPPFPHSLGYASMGKGLPIDVSLLDADDQDHLFWGEVAFVDGQLVTSGQVGYVGVVTGCAERVEDAVRAAYRRAENVTIPMVRYRNDIGQAFMSRDRERLIELGWLGHG